MTEQLSKDTITNDDDPDATVQKNDAWRTRNGWRMKHTQARIFYTGRRDDILALWQRMSGGRELRPSAWHEFVQAKELWDMVYGMATTISEHSLGEWANTELAEEGMSIMTPEFEEYSLVCIADHAMSKLDLSKGPPHTGAMYTREYAVQKFLATILIYAFADIYGREFRVEYKSHPALLVDRETVHRRLFRSAA